MSRPRTGIKLATVSAEGLERLHRLANDEGTPADWEWNKHQGFTEEEILEAAVAIEEQMLR